jgi:hypothetical protein
MTRGQTRDAPARDADLGIHKPRFRLKPPTHRGGHVDGAWWPHSDELMTELPSLVADLSIRMGAIARVTYNGTEWRTTPAQLATGGRVIRLDRTGGQAPNTVEILGRKGNKIVLLVVPFHIEPGLAHEIVMAAAAPGDASSVDTLLMISMQQRQTRTTRDAARERWDSHCRA